MLNGFAVEANQAAASERNVQTWLRGLNIAATDVNKETPIIITIGNRKLTGVLNTVTKRKRLLPCYRKLF
jgi:hypothetical protein